MSQFFFINETHTAYNLENWNSVVATDMYPLNVLKELLMNLLKKGNQTC